MNNKWNQSGNRYDVGSVATQKELLDKGVYSIELDPMTGQLYLERLQDDFKFGYKTYGIQQKFIDRVDKTYNNTNGNLGILLNGVKGTGKSVTAKMLCNTLNLPVILITKAYKSIPDFINHIQQDVLILVDEFEKVFVSDDYGDNSTSLLTVMDGVLDNGTRRVFLLTTNSLRINENLLQRPGRIRYLKTFTDLDKDTIEMIVDDLLIHPELRDDTIAFISKLKIITVDIVKAIVSEVNIHNEPPTEFENVFNIEKQNDVYKAYVVNNETGEKIFLRNITENNLNDLLDPDNDNNYFGITIKGKSYRPCEVISKEELLFKVECEKYIDGEYIMHYETVSVDKVESYHTAYLF